ncbi:MAG: peptidase T, partial [Bacteroidaceae bacterium]|nr:peptidase T [Bacteroidaceae bacterium]
VTAIAYLQQHPEVKHGTVRVAFNPDEEIGCGAHRFDVERFGCQWAYTIDGGEVGELEYENFNAASARFSIRGVNVHPGYAKGKMRNACLIAGELTTMLPAEERPETTCGYEGFYLLTGISATVEDATLTYIIRDHDSDIFQRRKQFILDIAARLNERYGEGSVTVEIKDQYRNMKSQLEDKMHIIDIARQAISETGVEPKVVPIRGGTDGAQLSFRGLPCPNIFTGGLNFHGRHEFIPIQSMERATQTIINICRIVGERQ